MSSRETPQNEGLKWKVMELNGGISSKPCLIHQPGYMSMNQKASLKAMMPYLGG